MERDNWPIIPHENAADVDCCGCLTVRERGDQADIVCNECGVLIQTVPLANVGAAMARLAETDVICSAICSHCGALNTFLGTVTVDAFVCQECGEGVENSRQYPVQ